MGGGSIAERKVRSLLSAGARVEVIAPVISKGLSRLVKTGAVIHRKSAYRKKYLSRSYLVIGATSDPFVNQRVSKDASDLRVWANIVDKPSISSFIVPAVLYKNGLIISVSTSGKAPALSKRIKKDLKDNMICRYSEALSVMAKERDLLKKSGCGFAERKRKLTRLADIAIKPGVK